MKKISLLLTGSIFFAAAWCAAQSQSSVETPFENTIAHLGSPQEVRSSRFGSDDIKVTCTFLPHSKLIAIAWEIDNPRGKLLTIGPSDITASDYIREFEKINPEQAARILYQGESYPQENDPTADAEAPSEYLVPGLRPRSEAENDIYASAFPFGETSASEITGVTYYIRYRSRGYVKSAIKVGGEVYAFEFE